MQVLQRQWDPDVFRTASYGFRPGRSARQAVAQAQQYIADGHGWCVDLDLEKFFDRVNHDKLMGQDPRQTGRGQAAAETHPGILECWGDGERVGQPKRGRDSRKEVPFRHCSK